MRPDGLKIPRRMLLAGLVSLGGIALAAPLAAPRLAFADDRTAPDGSASAVRPGEPNSATATVSYGPSVWMRIPRIGVDGATVDVGVSDGYYDVPWFDIGHHVDSANPGEPGNSIFNGHVLTINAGRVFYRLKELEPGDAVYIYTAAYRTGWAVVSTAAVEDGDDDFLSPSTAPRVTLYTCSGDFNPLERSFTERLVVVGQLVEVATRAPES